MLARSPDWPRGQLASWALVLGACPRRLDSGLRSGGPRGPQPRIAQLAPGQLASSALVRRVRAASEISPPTWAAAMQAMTIGRETACVGAGHRGAGTSCSNSPRGQLAPLALVRSGGTAVCDLAAHVGRSHGAMTIGRETVSVGAGDRGAGSSRSIARLAPEPAGVLGACPQWRGSVCDLAAHVGRSHAGHDDRSGDRVRRRRPSRGRRLVLARSPNWPRGQLAPLALVRSGGTAVCDLAAQLAPGPAGVLRSRSPRGPQPRGHDDRSGDRERRRRRSAPRARSSVQLAPGPVGASPAPPGQAAHRRPTPVPSPRCPDDGGSAG